MGLERAANSVLSCQVSARGIKFKSPVKAEVQYDCAIDDVSNEQQSAICECVNRMLSVNTTVTSTVSESSAMDKVPSGISGDPLYNILFDGNRVGLSHIPITMGSLGSLSGFKMLKGSFNANKKVLKVSYQFDVSSLMANELQKRDQSKNAMSSFYFEDGKDGDLDERAKYAKELITLIGVELGVKRIDPVHRDRLYQKVHDVLNQFQNVAYSKGLKAAVKR